MCQAAPALLTSQHKSCIFSGTYDQEGMRVRPKNGEQPLGPPLEDSGGSSPNARGDETSAKPNRERARYFALDGGLMGAD